MKMLIIPVFALGLTACNTLRFDKDRATEQRKQELCTDISTKDQPQCAGGHAPTP